MNAEFQWWLLILGIVIGGALVYLVLADLHDDRDDEEIALDEDLEENFEEEVGADDRPITGEPTGDSGVAGRWSGPTDRIPIEASVPADPAPADERGSTSVGDDPGVQRDGAKRETAVADLS
ncbi:MAG: hypothetical protein ABI628_04045 [Chloroflexota bacterium]